MAYRRDMLKAATRNLQAAEILDDTHRRDVAGYLFGIAAECALKEIMRNSGMRSEGDNQRGDPYFAHFPELKTLLRDQAEGRRQGKLLQYAQDDGFMQNWDIKMRYAGANEVKVTDVDRWKKQARDIVNDMESQ